MTSSRIGHCWQLLLSLLLTRQPLVFMYCLACIHDLYIYLCPAAAAAAASAAAAAAAAAAAVGGEGAAAIAV